LAEMFTAPLKERPPAAASCPCDKKVRKKNIAII
jgi:hypothetical protein